MPQTNKTNLDELKLKIQNKFASAEGTFALAFEEINNPSNSLFINEDEVFHAASTMKTPVMIEVFKQAEAGKFKLSDNIKVINEFRSIVDSSVFQLDFSDNQEDIFIHIGKELPILELIHKMITISSNLATNILIELVGAKNVTNTMRQLGAEKINVLRGVEDTKAFELGMNNTTTAKDLNIIYKAIAEGSIISKSACDSMISILLDQKLNNLFPKNLPNDVRIAHKTGSISGVLHDSGIIFMPDGRKYTLVILSKNLKDSKQGAEVIADVSRIVYDFMA
ncbi:MAG: class A beta-lactamase-related serine hydrolase, partial [Ignavibacteria bacterium]|nr:class A beta-lactamase-related serine hydrolase [Ignavibacteria bacterium]